MKYLKTTTQVCLFGLLAGSVHSQTFLLDFNTADGGALPGGASAWNQFAAPGDVTGLIADTSGSTAAGISVSQTGMNDSGNSGSSVFNNANGGPSWVTDDGLGAAADYFWTTNSSDSQLTLTFDGFTVGDVVSLDLWAARDANTASTVAAAFSFSLDGGSNWFGFNVLEQDGTASTTDGWNENNTLTQLFGADADAVVEGRYMNISNLELTGTSLMVRGEDSASGNFTVLSAARLAVIPEASAYAILAGLTALASVALRRRR